MKASLCCALFAFALVTTGCATDDPAGPGGKGDDPEERCDTAAVDDSGFCRAADGTFAPADCCVANEMCAAATFDGTACRAPNGQFAPLSCCESLCIGAALDEHGFCRGADGQFAFEACCADQCLANEPGPGDVEFLPGSCTDACGDQSDADCFCDEECVTLGDCCEDKVAECGGLDPLAFDANSCADACGGEAPSGCFCDDECVDFGDCCPDKVAECGGAGVLLPDCDEVACEGAAVDAHGTCRTPDGRFAKSTCCAAPPECATATVDASGFCRRADNGQFAPAVCCEGICEGSFIDRHGFCRNADGQFANTGCCADLCVARQGRSDRSDRAGSTASCNDTQRDADSLCPAEVESWLRECAAEALEDPFFATTFAEAVDACIHTPFIGLGDEPFEVFDDLCLPPLDLTPPAFCADGLSQFVDVHVPACEVKVLTE